MTDTLKSKIINLLLLITSLFGYLEWSGNSHLFLFQAEGEILSKLLVDPISVLHPFTVLPMIGQLLLIITLFQKNPAKVLTYISILCLGILLTLLFVIGIMSVRFTIIFSTIPFIVVAVIAIQHNRKQNKETIHTNKPTQ